MDIEIAALAGTAEIKLRDSLRRKAGLERIKGAGKLPKLIVVQKLAIRHQQSGPAPHPFVGQRELACCLNDAANCVRGRAIGTVAVGEIARILLKNSGGSDRISAVEQAMAPFAPKQDALLGGQQCR